MDNILNLISVLAIGVSAFYTGRAIGYVKGWDDGCKKGAQDLEKIKSMGLLDS